MAKKFWLFSLLGLILPLNVYAVSCTNGTFSKQYQNSDTLQWITFTNNPIDINKPLQININYSNSNIKNTTWTLEQKVIYRLPLLLANTPSINVYYGTSNSLTNITNYCSIGITDSSSISETTFTINVACTYTGTNSSANYIRINIGNFYNGLGMGTIHFYHQDQCLKITPSDTDRIINSIQEGVNNVNSNIQNSKNNINNNINNSTADIIDHVSNKINEVKSELQVTPSGQFVIDSSTAESVEQKEGNLRNGLLDPYQDGNLNDYISSGPNTPEYSNGNDFFWSIINRLIGPNSVLWILTSMILTLGIIKLVLSR